MTDYPDDVHMPDDGIETVKARGRQQSSSLDLTLLAEISDEYEVRQGDIFSVETEEDDKGRLVVKYTRVFAQVDE
jgi:hypothetical protein